MATEILADKIFQDGVGIATDGKRHARMALTKFGRVAVNLNDLADRSEGLPVEPGLLQAKARPQRNEEIRLLEQDVGVPLAPGVRTSDIQRMVGSNTVDRIPGDHKGDTEIGELIVNRVGCRPVDTSSQEYDW